MYKEINANEIKCINEITRMSSEKCSLASPIVRPGHIRHKIKKIRQNGSDRSMYVLTESEHNTEKTNRQNS